MAGVVARQLKQHSAFTSGEQEVLLGLLIAAARSVEPWEKFLKATAGLTNNQYNVLRILRGSHPSPSGVQRDRGPHDRARPGRHATRRPPEPARFGVARPWSPGPTRRRRDRKSTRLNSS